MQMQSLSQDWCRATAGLRVGSGVDLGFKLQPRPKRRWQRLRHELHLIASRHLRAFCRTAVSSFHAAFYGRSYIPRLAGL